MLQLWGAREGERIKEIYESGPKLYPLCDCPFVSLHGLEQRSVSETEYSNCKNKHENWGDTVVLEVWDYLFVFYCLYMYIYIYILQSVCRCQL